MLTFNIEVMMRSRQLRDATGVFNVFPPRREQKSGNQFMCDATLIVQNICLTEEAQANHSLSSLSGPKKVLAYQMLVVGGSRESQ